jgi:LysM repeat protein
MKYYWVAIFILLNYTARAQYLDSSGKLIVKDSVANTLPITPDSLEAISNTDVIITDTLIIDSSQLKVSDNTLESMVPEESAVVEAYLNADEINPYKYTALTVPKGAIINIIDSGMPNYITPCFCSVNSPFGYRRWGRYYQFHPGLDLNLPFGQPAHAAFDGVVRLAKMTPGYGNCVIIRHSNGLETLYGHFSELAVKPGQVVKAGDVVGYCGSTGYSFGAHLHFEIRYLGVPFDPAQVVFTQTDSLRTLKINIDNALFKSNTPPPPPKYKYVYHVVKKSETLSAIARKYKVTVPYLCKMNKVTTKTLLRPGRTLRIR